MMSSKRLATNNNQLLEGYKKTEVGVIPEDWKCEHLRDKIAITHGFGFKSQYFCSQGLYWLTTPGNFYEDGGFREIGEKQKYYNGPLPDIYLLQHGDLIVAMTEQAEGLLGSAAIIPKSGTYLHNQRLGKIQPISLDIELFFLYYIFNSKNFRLKVRETAAGTKVKHTSPTKLLEIATPLPPLPEQKTIAQTLSDVDALIAALDKHIAKKRNIKTGTMQQLLTGKTRLPELGEGKGYKKSAIGLTPEDWNIQTVSDIAIVRGGKRLPKGISLNDIPNPYPYIRVADMYEGGINTNDIKYVPEHIAPLIKSYRIYSTDLFISVAGTLGIIGEVPETMNGANLTENADRITGISCNKKFLLYALISERIKNEIDSQRTMGAQPKLALRRIEDFKLAFPNSDEEQQAIAQVLSDIDSEITALKKRRAKTQAIKQGMMQELLTGRTRLKIEHPDNPITKNSNG